MMSTMASSVSSVSGRDEGMDTHHHMKLHPPEMASRYGPEETNGNDIPKLVAADAPTRNRRKRRKGIPTRVAPTVIHNDHDSSGDELLPSFLMQTTPLTMAPKDLSGSNDPSFSQQGPTTPRNPSPHVVAAAPVIATPVTATNQKPTPPSRASTRTRRSSNNSKTQATTAKKPVVSNDDGTVSGMVFGYTKMTSSISTTSRGAKRVKLTVYMCNFCNFKSADNTAFWEHNVQHLFTCPHCSYKAFTRQSLVSHMVSDHPRQVPEEYSNIRAISVIDMQVTHNVTHNPPPPNRAVDVERTSSVTLPSLDDVHGSEHEIPSNPPVKSTPKPKIPECLPPNAHSRCQKPSDLKFRCDFCPYITSIFSAFMNHQKEHTAEVEKCTRTTPTSSGKLKSLLVGRSLSPTNLQKPELLLTPTSLGSSHKVSSVHTTSLPLTKAPPLQTTPLSLQKSSPIQTTPLALQKIPSPQTSPLHLTMTAANLSPKKRQAGLYVPKPKYPPGQCIKPCNTPVLKVPQPLMKSSPSVVPSSLSKSDSGEPTPNLLLQNELSKHAKCPICSFVLRSLAELESHIHLCHKSKLTVTGSTTSDGCKNGSDDYTWCCIYCTSKSENKQGVVNHIKAQHPGEKIRVWRWANRSVTPPPSDCESVQQMTVKLEPSTNTSDTEDSSLILKQIVSSTIDNVYGARFGDPPQTSPLGLSTSKPVVQQSQSLLKIPDVTNTTDIIEGKCAITVRKVTPSSVAGSSRQMRSLITGGLVTSPSKPTGSNVTTVSTASQQTSTKMMSTVVGKGKCAVVSSAAIPDLSSKAPILPPCLDTRPDSSDNQEREIDLSMKKDVKNKVIDTIKMEPKSPSSDTSNEFVKDGDELGDLSNLDVEVEVRKESLIPTDHISFDEDQRLHCCRHCTYQTKSYGHIVDHISTHTGMKTWSCCYCVYKSNRRHDLLRHVQKNHPGSKLKMIRNVPYSSKFSYPLKMSQRVSAARSMVAKKKTAPGKKFMSVRQRMIKQGLPVSPLKIRSPVKVEKWHPPPTVEFWECPICARRGSMEVMEMHIPTVHPEKIRKRLTKKEIMEPSVSNLIMSAKFSERRNLHIDLIALQKMPFINQDSKDVSLLKGLQAKLTIIPKILVEYKKVENKDIALEKELVKQQQHEMNREVAWLSGLNVDDQSNSETVGRTVICTTTEEQYRCQYCHFSDRSLYIIRKHLLWEHADLLLKCVDLRAKPPLDPRVIQMCQHCPFHSVSPADLLGHYSRNQKHRPRNDSDCTSSDDELPLLERARAKDSQASLEKRPPSRRVAVKSVTKSGKNFQKFKFVHGTHLQCRYCKEFKIHDSMIMKDHLLTEHPGQPAVAIDIRSRELRRASRVFFCPILECYFTEYGPDSLVKHLNQSHPETSFDALVIQIWPKESRNSEKNRGATPPLPPPPPPPPPKVETSKHKSHSKKENSKRERKSTPKGGKGGGGGGVGVVEEGIYFGGAMPKISADLNAKNRYWCVYCDAHSSSVENVKGHFLEHHMEHKAQLIDARARILRKKSRLFFCWNVTCNFTTFLEPESTLHEQSQACLDNFAPDEPEEGKAGEYSTPKVGNNSSAFSSPAGTPERPDQSDTSAGGSRMFQCLYCSLMMSTRANIRRHMVTEHACSNGGYSEISTDFNKDGDVVMNVGGAAESDTATDD